MKLRWYEKWCLRIALRRIERAAPPDIASAPLDFHNNPGLLMAAGSELAPMQNTDAYKYLLRRLTYRALELAKTNPDNDKDMWFLNGQIKAYLSVDGVVNGVVAPFKALVRRQQEGAN